MIGLCPLASGSKGNCIYLGTQNCKILIDAGLSFKETKLRLREIGVDINEIDAILITHDHADHIAGLKIFSEKTSSLVLANAETAKGIYNIFNKMFNFKIFTTGESFEFKDLIIFPFTIPHDTLDPVGFVIKAGGLKIGICTDFGFVGSLIKKSLEGCDYLYIEANHQVSMVHASNRPYVYKQRVLSRQGHLSNDQCIALLQDIVHPQLKHIFLAHLSQECNSPELIKEMIKNLLEQKQLSTKFSIAYQKKISEKICF